MPGGLLQITTAGSNDIILTGNPQITFFNIIYRRYTNFGSKIVELGFDNSINFNSTSVLTIPKNSGDLLSKLTLKIKLPQLDLNDLTNQYLKQTTYYNDINKNSGSLNSTNITYISYYNYFIKFYNNLKNIINNFFTFNDNLTTITYIQDLSVYIQKYLNNDQYLQFFTSVSYFLNSGLINTENSTNINLFLNASLFINKNDILTYIYNNWTNIDISYQGFKYAVNKNILILEELNEIMYNILKKKIFGITNFEIGWVNKIGIYLINYIDFYIGSNKINSLSDNYINNYGDLYYKNQKIYSKLVGIDQSINKFAKKHDEYNLYLPIPFWFNSNYGLSFPLIALQFNTVQIRINLKNFIECIKINIDSSIDSDETKTFVINYLINNISSVLKTQLEITIVAEYIFLDSIERKKFAQSAHEYLITQVQEIEFDNLTVSNNSFQLDFFHCCKDIYWFASLPFDINNIFNNDKNAFLYSIPNTNYKINYKNYTYIYDYVKMLYNPYTLFDPNTYINGLELININYKDNIYKVILDSYFDNLNQYQPYLNIIQESYLYFNSVVLIGDVFNYYNYLQPYSYYNNTPQIGFNVYSFSLSPMETQPSGSCNLSRIPDFYIKLKINNFNLINNTSNNIKFNYVNVPTTIQYKLVIQSTNYNVLRFIGGIAAAAYTY